MEALLEEAQGLGIRVMGALPVGEAHSPLRSPTQTACQEADEDDDDDEEQVSVAHQRWGFFPCLQHYHRAFLLILLTRVVCDASQSLVPGAWQP